MNPGGADEWEKVRDALDEEDPAARIYGIHRILARGVHVSPAAEPPVHIGLPAWERRFHRLADLPMATGYEEIDRALMAFERDSLALLERRRLTAILAIHLLESEESDLNLRSRAITYVSSWMREVLSRQPRSGETYFPLVRSGDTTSYPPKVRAVRDLHLEEVRLFLFRPGRNPALRVPFKCEPLRSMVPELGRWMLTRYAFPEVRKLLRTTCDAPTNGDVATENAVQARAALKIQYWCMPRIAATVAVGHFVIASQKDILRMMDAGVNSVWGAAVASATLLGGFSGLLKMEVNQRAPSYPQKNASVGRMLWVSLLWSLFFGGLALLAASSIHRDKNDFELPFLMSIRGGAMLLLESCAALFFGYLLQILWDDQPITDPL